MTREMLSQILEAEGAKAAAKAHTLPDAVDVTIFVSSNGEPLTVPRVAKVELREKYVCFETSKGERFFFAYEDVLGLRTQAAPGSKDRPGGFGR